MVTLWKVMHDFRKRHTEESCKEYKWYIILECEEELLPNSKPKSYGHAQEWTGEIFSLEIECFGLHIIACQLL